MMMRHIKLFEKFENDELDFDEIKYELRDRGWGDLSNDRFEDFESSEYYSGTLDTFKYINEFDDYLSGISTGDIDDDVSASDIDDDVNDDIDLSIELENKLRTIPSDSEMNVDDFLSEFGVDPKDMTGFAWVAILNGAQKYVEMSDEEFMKLYDEYKNNK